MDKRKTLDILQRDYIKNYPAICLIKSFQQYEEHIIGNAAFVRGQDEMQKLVIISPGTREDTLKLFSKITPADHYFFVLEDWVFHAISRDREVTNHMDCFQVTLPEDLPLPSPSVDGLVDIGEEFTDYIYENYDVKELCPVEYIRHRLKTGPAVGFHAANQLVGWVLTHDEGTIGCLTVLPEYRHRGIAASLVSLLSQKIRDRGGLPCAHIKTTNQASLSLFKKLGFVQSAHIHWFQQKQLPWQ